MNDQDQTQERMNQAFFEHILRLEVLAGIEDPPPEWQITPERIVSLMKKTGLDYETCEQHLIKNFGRLNDDPLNP